MKSLSDFLTPDEQRIRNVPGRKLRRIIDALPPFDVRAIPAAWSHFMALCAGTHPWPDANHRTAYIAFAESCAKAHGIVPTLSAEAAAALTTESKRLRDPHRRASPGKASYYTVADLADPQHPYRVLYREFEARLQLNPA